MKYLIKSFTIYIYPIRLAIKFHNTAVLHSENLPSLLRLALPPPIDDFYASPTLFCSCLSKSHKYGNYDKAPYTDPFYHYSHKTNLKAVLTCHQAKLTPLLLPRIPTKHLHKCTFSKNLTYN